MDLPAEDLVGILQHEAQGGVERFEDSQLFLPKDAYVGVGQETPFQRPASHVSSELYQAQIVSLYKPPLKAGNALEPFPTHKENLAGPDHGTPSYLGLKLGRRD